MRRPLQDKFPPDLGFVGPGSMRFTHPLRGAALTAAAVGGHIRLAEVEVQAVGSILDAPHMPAKTHPRAVLLAMTLTCDNRSDSFLCQSS